MKKIDGNEAHHDQPTIMGIAIVISAGGVLLIGLLFARQNN